MTLCFQLYDDGRMSEQVRQWQVGSAAEWRGPFGDFIYTPNKVEFETSTNMYEPCRLKI